MSRVRRCSPERTTKFFSCNGERSTPATRESWRNLVRDTHTDLRFKRICVPGSVRVSPTDTCHKRVRDNYYYLPMLEFHATEWFMLITYCSLLTKCIENDALPTCTRYLVSANGTTTHFITKSVRTGISLYLHIIESR